MQNTKAAGSLIRNVLGSLLMIAWGCGTGLNAGTIAYYADYKIDPQKDVVAAALQRIERTGNTIKVTESLQEFSMLLRHGETDLAIIFLQDLPPSADAMTDIADYLKEGGALIVSDATRTKRIGELFSMAYTETKNNHTMQLTADLGGWTGRRYFHLVNDGYHTFSYGLRVDGGTVLARFSDTSPAIVYRNRRLYVGMVTDAFGIENFEAAVEFFTVLIAQMLTSNPFIEAMTLPPILNEHPGVLEPTDINGSSQPNFLCEDFSPCASLIDLTADDGEE